jgi:hypothetical protein
LRKALFAPVLRLACGSRHKLPTPKRTSGGSSGHGLRPAGLAALRRRLCLLFVRAGRTAAMSFCAWPSACAPTEPGVRYSPFRHKDRGQQGLGRGGPVYNRQARRKLPAEINCLFMSGLTVVAERAGFEPASRLLGNRFSRAAPSTTRTPLRDSRYFSGKRCAG